MYLIEEAIKDAQERLNKVDKDNKMACKVALVTYRALLRLVARPFEFDEKDFNSCPSCFSKLETDDKYCWQCGQAVDIELNKSDV